MIFGSGLLFFDIESSCPPSITLFAILDTLIAGDDAAIKCSLAGTVRTSYYYQFRRLIRRFHSVHFLYAVQLLNVLWHTVAHIVHHILFEPP